ncbi:uridine diphosphate-N-acetylglucosamine-binding protein YvcK [Nakamurella silvestris]|nr:uridine diphosphate-N-acetylglucosamine-binding protein YvcK [Nakamurella silvestris]
MTAPAPDPVVTQETGPVTGPGTRRRPKVVSLGGGHGLWAILRALRLLDADITAIVTVADDGGSSGRLRREFPLTVPPGDLRMALGALSPDDENGSLWGRAFQHRFAGHGVLAGHPIGNLLLVGLAELTGDPVKALDAAAELLHCDGRVLPMSCQPLQIVADVTGLDVDPSALRRIRGQVAVASTPGRVVNITVEPVDAPACPEALKAIAEADLITLGPGSWLTSVLPHLLLPDLRDAIAASSAHIMVVLNLEPQPGETDGFSPEQHLEVLSAHAPHCRIDTVLADEGSVILPQRLASAAGRIGAELLLASVADPQGAPRHDPEALARVLGPVVERLGRGDR